MAAQSKHKNQFSNLKRSIKSKVIQRYFLLTIFWEKIGKIAAAAAAKLGEKEAYR